mgnify:CR=1 FL=1
MKFTKPHGFSHEEALARAQALLEYWTRYGVKVSWSGSSGHVSGRVKGVKFNGAVSVGEKEVSADIEVGFLARKLGGEAYVDKKLTEYLDPARSLESLQARNEKK